MDTAVPTILILFLRNYAKTSRKRITWFPKWIFLAFRNKAIVKVFKVNFIVSFLLRYVILLTSCILNTGTRLAMACCEPDV